MTHCLKNQKRENRSKDMDFDHLQEIYVINLCALKYYYYYDRINYPT